MTKTLKKATMHGSKFKNIYNKKRTNDNWTNYKKQRNLCVNLLRKTKADYFQNLNIRDYPITENSGKQSSRTLLKKD